MSDIINQLFNQYVYWDLINDDYYYNCKVYIQVDGGDLCS